MAESTTDSQRNVAELIAQLARMVYGDGFAEGLTAAQWTALRYFSRANRFSRTVSAFAEFHATTRGTASQTVKSLVKNGYLSRRRMEHDGRSVRFDLTEKSVVLLDRDPFQNLVTAIAELSKSSRQVTNRSLVRTLRVLADHYGKKEFGTCPLCRYVCVDVCDAASTSSGYRCEFIDEALQEAEIDELCVNFEAGR